MRLRLRNSRRKRRHLAAAYATAYATTAAVLCATTTSATYAQQPQPDQPQFYAPPPMQPQMQPYPPQMMQPQTGGSIQGQGYDWTVALILSILVGELGVDRFYTGSIMLGILKLVTFGGCGVWWIIDIILIVTGSYKDAQGRPLVRKL